MPTKGLPKSITTNGTFTVISTAKSEILLIENNVLISTIKSDKQPTSVALSNCGTELAVGHENASIKFYLISSDKRALNLEKEVNGNKGEITCISYSPDNIHVAASDSQRSVMVYNKEKELVISEWIFHTSRVNSIKWSKDGKKACSGSVDASVEIWQLNEPMKHLCIKGAHLDSVTDAAFLNESTIVSVGNDGFIKVSTIIH